MTVALVRYGAIPEVARCSFQEDLSPTRDECVIVETHRGLEVGKILEIIKPSPEPGATEPTPSFKIQRPAENEDLQRREASLKKLQSEFAAWEQRIEEWEIELQLVEMDTTLNEEKLILYVLNDRGPECTKLAIQAAAAGLGIIEVQPVGADGPVILPTGGGGCGSCGCH